MRFTIKGRPITKKNSKQIFRNAKTGRVFITSSNAFKRFEDEALFQLIPIRKKLKEPFSSPMVVTLTFFIKGKFRLDVDNGATSILDILEDGRIIENDNLVYRLIVEKFQDCADWETIVEIDRL